MYILPYCLLFLRLTPKNSFDHGVKIAGASVFFVDLSVDGYPIIIPDSCKVLEDDTVESLSQRILEIEHRILPEAID